MRRPKHLVRHTWLSGQAVHRTLTEHASEHRLRESGGAHGYKRFSEHAILSSAYRKLFREIPCARCCWPVPPVRLPPFGPNSENIGKPPKQHQNTIKTHKILKSSALTNTCEMRSSCCGFHI